MPLTPDEERRVEDLLREAAEEGRRAGRDETLRGMIASRARQVLREDYRRAGEVLEGFDRLADALYHMARLFLPGSVARWRERMRPVVSDAAETATEGASEVLGRFDARRPAANDFLEDYVSELADRLAETTYRQAMQVIREAYEEGRSVPDAARGLREKAGIETPRRAKLIARNELQRISKGASWAQALESGVISGKIRREQDDARTRPAHRELDGEERSIEEPYSNGELWCGQTDINCRGYDEFVIDWEALDERGPEPGKAEELDLEEPEERGDPHDEVAPFFDDPDLEISEEETEEIVRRISSRAARRLFDSAAYTRPGNAVGLEWEGRIVQRGDLLPMDAQHYLNHVGYEAEWPDGTDFEGYLDSVREVVLDPETEVFVERYQGREQVGFLRRSGELEGPAGYGWVLVEYVLRTGHVHTAFQPEFGRDWVLNDPHGDREIIRWLRRLEPETE